MGTRSGCAAAMVFRGPEACMAWREFAVRLCPSFPFDYDKELTHQKKTRATIKGRTDGVRAFRTSAEWPASTTRMQVLH